MPIPVNKKKKKKKKHAKKNQQKNAATGRWPTLRSVHTTCSNPRYELLFSLIFGQVHTSTRKFIFRVSQYFSRMRLAGMYNVVKSQL